MFKYLSLLKSIITVVIFTVMLSAVHSDDAYALFPGAKLKNCTTVDGVDRCYGNCDPTILIQDRMDGIVPQPYMQSCESKGVTADNFYVPVTFDPDQLFVDTFMSAESVSLRNAVVALPAKDGNIKINESISIYAQARTIFETIEDGQKICVYASMSTGDTPRHRLKYEVIDRVPATVEEVDGLRDLTVATGGNQDDVDVLNTMPTEAVGMNCVFAPLPPPNLLPPVWGAMVSPVCTDYFAGNSSLTAPFTSVVVECIEETMQQIFDPNAVGVSVFSSAHDLLKDIVRAFLALYIITIGFKFMRGKNFPGRDELGWYLIKIAMVVWFALGSGMMWAYPKLVDITRGLSVMVLNAGSDFADPALSLLYQSYVDARHDLSVAEKNLNDAKAEKEKAKVRRDELQILFNDKLNDLATAPDVQVTLLNQEDTCAVPAQVGPPFANTQEVLDACQNWKDKINDYNAVLASQVLLARREDIIANDLGGIWNIGDLTNTNSTIATLNGNFTSNGPLGSFCSHSDGVTTIKTSVPGYPGYPSMLYTPNVLAMCDALNVYNNYPAGDRLTNGGLNSSCSGWSYTNGLECQPNGVIGNAHTGNRLIELDVSGNSCIYQDITAPVGLPIQFSFWYRSRTGNSSSDMSVSFEGVTKIASVGYTNTSWVQYSFTSDVTTSPSRIMLCATGLGEGLGALVDDMVWQKSAAAATATPPAASSAALDAAIIAQNNLITQLENNLAKKALLEEIKDIDDKLLGITSGYTRLKLCDASLVCEDYNNNPVANMASTDPRLTYLINQRLGAITIAEQAYGLAVQVQNNAVGNRNALLTEIYGTDMVSNLNPAANYSSCSATPIPRYNGTLNDGGIEEQLFAARDAFEYWTCQVAAFQAVYDSKKTVYDNAAAALSGYGSMPMSPTGYNYCDFRYVPYIAGKEHIQIFDMVDCKIAKYLGIGDNTSNPSVPQSLIIFATSIISSPLGLLIYLFGMTFTIFMIMLVTRIVHIYLMAFISVIFLVFVSPIIIPFALFDQTKDLFGRWLTELMAMSLQPVLLVAFLSFMFVVVDVIAFGGNRNFDANNRIVLNASNECDDPDTMGCIFRTIQYGRTGNIGLGDSFPFRLTTVDLGSGKDLILFIEIIKLIAVCFITSSLLNTIEEIISKMSGSSGGGAAGIGAAPVASPAQIMGYVFQQTRKGLYMPLTMLNKADEVRQKIARKMDDKDDKKKPGGGAARPGGAKPPAAAAPAVAAAAEAGGEDAGEGEDGDGGDAVADAGGDEGGGGADA